RFRVHPLYETLLLLLQDARNLDDPPPAVLMKKTAILAKSGGLTFILPNRTCAIFLSNLNLNGGARQIMPFHSGFIQKLADMGPDLPGVVGALGHVPAAPTAAVAGF